MGNALASKPIRIGSYNLQTSGTDDAYFRQANNTLTTRHTGGSNLAMVDGHVKWYLPDRVAREKLISPAGDGSDCSN